MIKAYLASGWFNEQEKIAMNKVRDCILQFPEIKLHSPFYDGIVLNKSNDSLELRKNIFNENMAQIANADLMIAVIDDFECGTMVEYGAAAMLNWQFSDGPAIIAY